MFFIDHCLPKMNEFGQEAANTVLLVAPEYIGKLVNTGEPTPVFRTPTLWRDARPERSPGWLHDTRQSSASGRWS
jgi:hypothetical protein